LAEEIRIRLSRLKILPNLSKGAPIMSEWFPLSSAVETRIQINRRKVRNLHQPQLTTPEKSPLSSAEELKLLSKLLPTIPVKKQTCLISPPRGTYSRLSSAAAAAVAATTAAAHLNLKSWLLHLPTNLATSGQATLQGNFLGHWVVLQPVFRGRSKIRGKRGNRVNMSNRIVGMAQGTRNKSMLIRWEDYLDRSLLIRTSNITDNKASMDRQGMINMDRKLDTDKHHPRVHLRGISTSMDMVKEVNRIFRLSSSMDNRSPHRFTLLLKDNKHTDRRIKGHTDRLPLNRHMDTIKRLRTNLSTVNIP